MPTAIIRLETTIAGIAISGNLQGSGNVPLGWNPTLPAGNVGSLTTRTDAKSGTVTLSQNCVIVAGSVDLYWTNADNTVGRQLNMTAGTPGGADPAKTIALTSGASNDSVNGNSALPLQNAAVTIVQQTTVTEVGFDGTKLRILAASCPSRCVFQFLATATVVAAIEIQANGAYSWSGGTTPINNAAITSIVASQAGVSAADLAIGMILQ